MPRMRSTWPALIVTGLLVIGYAGAAQAQMLNPFGVNNGNTVTSDDYKIAGAAVKKLLNDPPALGRYEDWSNPASGNRGKVTIIDMFTKDSMPCRKVSSHTEFSKKGSAPSTIVMDACKVPAGQWKIAS